MPVQTVERVIAILRALSGNKPPLGVSELGRYLGIHKSTLYGLLTSLEQGRLVERDSETRKWRLGIGLLELADTVVHTHKLVRIAHPYLHYLADSVGETAYLAVQDGDQILNLLQERPSDLRKSADWIARAPLHSTSTGKIFLAYMSVNELKAYLHKGLDQLTDRTIIDATDLRRELERAREQGFATSFEENREGENAIAVPVGKSEGTVVAALGVVGPSYSLTSEKAMTALERIRGVATEISLQIRSAPLRDPDSPR